MVRNADGSFRHRILWPVTEAPYSYTNKRTFTPRYDTYLTLRPGETFTATAFACAGKPPWPDYGFAAVFPVAWRLLKCQPVSIQTSPFSPLPLLMFVFHLSLCSTNI